MKQSDLEAALLEGLLQGVKDHVGKITENLIADSGTGSPLASEMIRFTNGLRATRGFYDAALAVIQKEFGDTTP